MKLENKVTDAPHSFSQPLSLLRNSITDETASPKFAFNYVVKRIPGSTIEPSFIHFPRGLSVVPSESTHSPATAVLRASTPFSAHNFPACPKMEEIQQAPARTPEAISRYWKKLEA